MSSLRKSLRLGVLMFTAGSIGAGTMMQAVPLQAEDAATAVSAAGGQDKYRAAGADASKKYRNLFPDVVATVNGESISGRELENAVAGEMASIGSPEWKNLREDYRGNLLYNLITSLVNTKLMYAEAVASGILVSDSEVQDEYLKIAKTFKNDEEMKAFLADQNIDRDKMIENIHSAMTVSKYVNEIIGSRVTVTLEEMKEFYSGNPDEFRHPDLVRTSHIKVDAGKTRKEDELARQRIEELLARVTKGEDFAALAREHSSSPSAVRGGDVGYASREMLPAEYAEAAFSLPVGGTQIVKTQEGYFIVKITGKKEKGMSTFDESKDQLAEFLKNEKTQDELYKKINQLRDAADIEILIPVGPALEP